MRSLVLLLCACTPPLTPAPVDSDVGVDTGFIGLEEDRCSGLDRSVQPIQGAVDRFVAQEALAPLDKRQVVYVGDAFVERWEDAFRAASSRGVVQRAVPGARMTDVAQHTPELVVAHEPRGVVIAAGWADLAGGAETDRIIGALRCSIQQVREAYGRTVPVVVVGLPPSRAGWEDWPRAVLVNAAIEAIARGNTTVWYADVPAAFLEFGEPPDQRLYAADELHLSQEGYFVWEDVVLPALTQAVTSARPVPTNAEHPEQGAIVRLDLGPSNQQDGVRATADGQGRIWNAWHPLEGGVPVLSGERMGGLVTTAGVATGFSVVVTGGFKSRGLQHGALINPSKALLGELAYDAATADFFYTDGPQIPGGLSFEGLDPARTYTVRLFGSSATVEERRATRYVIYGSEQRETGLTTSGRDVGNGGYDGNNFGIAVVNGLAPDRFGQIHIDVQIAVGSTAYLNLIELSVE